MAIIKTDTIEMLVTSINRYFMDEDANINLYQIRDRAHRKNVTFGVNWSALGTVAPDRAMQFAKHLEQVAYICKVLNNENWTEEFGSPYDTDEDYWKAVKWFYDGLKAGNDIQTLVDYGI